MNLRPSGYEPDELPDCSTPHQEGRAFYKPNPRAAIPKLAPPIDREQAAPSGPALDRCAQRGAAAVRPAQGPADQSIRK